MRSILSMVETASFCASRLPEVNQLPSFNQCTQTRPWSVMMVALLGLSLSSNLMVEIRAIKQREPDTPVKACLALLGLFERPGR